MDVPVIIGDMLQQFFVEFVEAPQLQFIDIVVGFVASQRQGSQCKLCRRLRFARCSSWIGTRPSLCNDRPRWSRQLVQSGGAAGAVPARLWTAVSQDVPEFPAKPGGASDSVHRKSWVMTAVKGFLAHFAPFFALLRVVPELSASRSWGALDDEEFFVIEGWGVALTPGVVLPGVRPPVVH